MHSAADNLPPADPSLSPKPRAQEDEHVHNDFSEQARQRSSRDAHDRHWRQMQERSHKFLTEDWPTRTRQSTGSAGNLVALIVAIGAILGVAAYLGYSPAEVWDWTRTKVEHVIDAWSNG